jgi:hypothetical protein
MTQDEIMKMARQAGFEGCAELTWEDVICTEELLAFAKLVAQHEREACAKICEKHADTYEAFEKNQFADVAWSACIDICDAIEARGQA